MEQIIHGTLRLPQRASEVRRDITRLSRARRISSFVAHRRQPAAAETRDAYGGDRRAKPAAKYSTGRRLQAVRGAGGGRMSGSTYTQTGTRKTRSPAKRPCDRCHRWHKPLSESVRFCGACSARLLALAARGWGRT